MALQTCGLNLDRVHRELQPHGSLEFPCAGYASHHGAGPEDTIPWHWHEELEIAYIAEGQLRLKTPGSSFLLKEGQLAAINSNVLHFAYGEPEGSLRSLVFSPALVAGDPASVFGRRYIQPLVSCRGFTGLVIDGEDAPQAAEWFNSAFLALRDDSYGYEFTVREGLSKLCLYLYARLCPQGEGLTASPDADQLRIRKMLDLIHRDYAQDLSLGQIASAAGISERECLRCFKKLLQISPVQYLLRYRVMQGAELLVREPGRSVAEIASLCGFDSPSNFAMVFKRIYGRSPREHRQTSVGLNTI